MSEIEIHNESQRLVAGWASVEVIDSQSDVVPVEELKKAFLNLMDRGGTIIYGHRNAPVGKILQWEIKEHPITNALGVYMIVKINSGYEFDDAVWAAIKGRKLKGFSIGGKGVVEKAYIDRNGRKTQVNYLKNLQLNEVSVVDDPANPYALIDQIAMVAKCSKCGTDSCSCGVESVDNMVKGAEEMKKDSTDDIIQNRIAEMDSTSNPASKAVVCNCESVEDTGAELDYAVFFDDMLKNINELNTKLAIATKSLKNVDLMLNLTDVSKKISLLTA